MNKFLVRLTSGLAFGAVAITAMLYHKYTFFLLMAFILIGSLNEFFQITSDKREDAKGFFIGKWFVIVASFIVFMKSFILLSPPLGIPDTSSILSALTDLIMGLRDTGLVFYALIPALGMLFMLVELFSKSGKPFENIGWRLVALVWIVLPVIITSKIYFDKGGPFILALFMLIWMYDTACYVFGNLLGRKKLFERISPKKTVEGMIAGIAFLLIVSYFAIQIPYLDVLSRWQWMTLAFVVSITATFGDLVESMLKRSLNIKDSGSLMPGHGGFLDRMDAFFLTVPFVSLFLWIFAKSNEIMLVFQYLQH